MLQHKMNLKN